MNKPDSWINRDHLARLTRELLEYQEPPTVPEPVAIVPAAPVDRPEIADYAGSQERRADPEQVGLFRNLLSQVRQRARQAGLLPENESAPVSPTPNNSPETVAPTEAVSPESARPAWARAIDQATIPCPDNEPSLPPATSFPATPDVGPETKKPEESPSNETDTSPPAPAAPSPWPIPAESPSAPESDSVPPPPAEEGDAPPTTFTASVPEPEEETTGEEPPTESISLPITPSVPTFASPFSLEPPRDHQETEAPSPKESLPKTAPIPLPFPSAKEIESDPQPSFPSESEAPPSPLGEKRLEGTSTPHFFPSAPVVAVGLPAETASSESPGPLLGSQWERVTHKEVPRELFGAQSPLRERLRLLGGWILGQRIATSYALMDTEGGVLAEEGFEPSLFLVVNDFTRGWRRLLEEGRTPASRIPMACDGGVLTVIPCRTKFGHYALACRHERALSQEMAGNLAVTVRELVEQ